MKPLFLLVFAAAAWGCGTRQEPAAVPKERNAMETRTMPYGSGVPAECPLRVDFGSYAMGIDGGAAEAVRALLDGDPGVAEATTYPWGREGEYTLCVTTRGEGDAERLFHAISRLFPADPRGPLSVSTRSGLRFAAGGG